MEITQLRSTEGRTRQERETERSRLKIKDVLNGMEINRPKWFG
jgi:hypothetical protein